MTRLPDLERSLLEAARRVEAQDAGASSPARRRSRWRRRGTPLLVTAGLAVAGGAVAVAAVSGLLDTGGPVPSSGAYASIGTIKPGTSVVLPLRVADPDGGPPWGIGVFDVDTRGRDFGRVAEGIGTVRCVRVGRVQDGTLGVVGRDGVFGDDGRFHRLLDRSSQSGGCGVTTAGNDLLMRLAGPPTPASGYTGRNGPPVGGCLERRLYPTTSSPQTRRRLRGVPVCDPADKRIVTYGFAGRQAVRATLANDRIRLTQKTGPSGAYLFVLKPRAAGKDPLQLTVTYRDGTVCREPTRSRHPNRRPPLDPDCFPPPGF